MTKNQAVIILKKHNEWRRYKGDVDKSPPIVPGKKLGEAIDVAVNLLESSDA